MTMNQTTEADLTALHSEENRQELALLLQPLIQQAIRDAMPTDLAQVVTELRQARDELQQARDEILDVKTRYLTAEQAEQSWQQYANKISDPLKERLDQHLTDLNIEDERRHQAYIQRIAGAEQKAQQSDQRAVEVEKRTAALEAKNEQRFSEIDKKLASIRRDIDTSVKSVADSVKRVDSTFAKFIERSEKRIEKMEQNNSIVAREVVDLQATRVRTEKRLDELQDDFGNQRQDVDGLRSDIATKVTTTDLKVKHIDNEISEIKQRQSNQTAEQAVVKAWVIDIQVQTKAAFWLLNTWVGRGVLIAVLTLLGLSNWVS
jgi:predicted  nucleic acid-binding Zn-ribbon protein